MPACVSNAAKLYLKLDSINLYVSNQKLLKQWVKGLRLKTVKVWSKCFAFDQCSHVHSIDVTFAAVPFILHSFHRSQNNNFSVRKCQGARLWHFCHPSRLVHRQLAGDGTLLEGTQWSYQMLLVLWDRPTALKRWLCDWLWLLWWSGCGQDNAAATLERPSRSCR